MSRFSDLLQNEIKRRVCAEGEPWIQGDLVFSAGAGIEIRYVNGENIQILATGSGGAHATQHEAGGPDEIDLGALAGSLTAAQHGNLNAGDPHAQYQLRAELGQVGGYPGLDGAGLVPRAELGTGTPSASTFLRGDGAWATPAAGGASITAATLDLGSAPRTEHRIAVTDAAVTGSSKIQVGWGNTLDTDANGPDTDAVTFSARAGTGQFTVLVSSASPLAGALKIHYLAG